MSVLVEETKSIHTRLYERWMSDAELAKPRYERGYIRERRRVWRLRKQIKHLQKAIRRRNDALMTLICSRAGACSGVMGFFFGHDFSIQLTTTTTLREVPNSELWRVRFYCKRCGGAE